MIPGLRSAAILAALLASVPLWAAELREVMVPMRDGKKLATTILLPDAQGAFPVVLTRTPYGKDRGGDPLKTEAMWVTNGYARVVQDCRGRFKSEGEYRAFVDDIEDGYDTVEWIAAQSWSNGKVGMIGGSATGITANLAAMSGAPHLLANFVSVAYANGYRHSSFPGGVYLQNLNEGWYKAQGVTLPDLPRPLLRPYGVEDRKRDMRTYYSKIPIPVYNVGGWYDIFSAGTVENFAGLQTQGAAGARGNQKLMMGPFGHGPLSGDLKYPADSNDRSGKDRLRWFDQWLKGVDTGIRTEPAVRYFVMGDTMEAGAPGNEWRTASAWPPASTVTSYYFQAGKALTRDKPAAGGGHDSYVYDPKDPVPSVGGNNLMMARGPMDQRTVSGRPDVLKYETPALAEALEITGGVVAELWVSTDAADTDFMVKLVDVYPNGYEALVLDQAFRLRYHEGFEKAARVEKNKAYKINVDLWPTALVFNRGHKIAVHVSSSNSPRFEAHSNTWEPLASYDQAVKARNTVYHDGQHASRLLLPVTKVYPTPPQKQPSAALARDR